MIIPLQATEPLFRIAERLGCELPKSTAIPKRLVTDSRQVSPGDLFCALVGKQDGHLYIPDAIRKGALAVLIEKPLPLPIPTLCVPSVPLALTRWAAAWLDEVAPKTVAITGSVGKTTTKEVTSALLSPFFSLHATVGNYNNQLGVPFTILSMQRKTTLLVAECGMNAKGEIASLSKLLQPDIGIITNIGTSHIGKLGSREAIAQAKAELREGMRPDGLLLYPANEPLLDFLEAFPGQRIHPLTEKQFFHLTGHAPPKDTTLLAALGFALALGKALSVPEEALRAQLYKASCLLPRKRILSEGGITFIDDSYNAAPESVMAAMQFLNSVAQERRCALLGDMLELGRASNDLHRKVGRATKGYVDLLFCMGEYAPSLTEGAKEVGVEAVLLPADMPQKQTVATLLSFLHAGDTLLVKASHALDFGQLTTHLIMECKRQTGIS